MDKIKLLLMVLVLVLGVEKVYAQERTDVIGRAKEAIKVGSAKELAQHLHQTVDVSLEGRQETYSKAQAEIVFRDFFKSHPPVSFAIIHKGSSKSGQPFAIGQYKSSLDTFRVFMKVKTINTQQLIHEISFSKE